MSIRGRRKRTPLWSLVVACLIVALALGTAQALAQSSAVTDVPKTHWAYQAVESLLAKGYLELYPDSTFQGDEPVSRYQFAQVIHRVVEAVESGSIATTQEDVELVRKLTTEFKDELVQLAADMDKLSASLQAAQKERVVLREDVNSATGLAQEVEQRATALEGVVDLLSKRLNTAETGVSDLVKQVSSWSRSTRRLAISELIFSQRNNRSAISFRSQ